jgi:hypothetical protein
VSKGKSQIKSISQENSQFCCRDIEFQLHTHKAYTKLRVYITETSLIIKYDRLKTESAEIKLNLKYKLKRFPFYHKNWSIQILFVLEPYRF